MSSPSASSAPIRPRRLTAVCGTLAAAGLIAAFFLPLFQVERSGMERLTDRVAAEARSRSLDPQLAEDFVAAFESVRSQGHVTPADLVHYARTAGRQRDNIIYDDARSGSAGDPAARTFERLLLVLLVLAAAPPVGALLLIAYFLYHGLRRARSPMLVLALVVGALGGALPVGYQYARYELAPHLEPAAGHWVMLAASCALVLAAMFGVTLRNWWRVYVGGALMLACVGGIGWAYLQGALTS